MKTQERIRLSEETLVQLDEIVLLSHSLIDTIDKLREWQVLKSEDEFYCDSEDFSMEGLIMGDLYAMYEEQNKLQDIKASFIILKLFFVSFIKRQSYKDAAEETKVERHTISRYYKMIRKEISIQQPLGTNPIEEFNRENEQKPVKLYSPAVEADETLITHLANIQGVYNSQCWVLGAIDRLNGDFRLKVIGQDKSKPVIKEFFLENVNTNPRFAAQTTRVYTDGLKSYQVLPSLGYRHIVVVHSKGFGSGINTTNRIESLWAHAKKYNFFNRGQKYESIAEVQEVIDEISWRIHCQRQHLNMADELAMILKYKNN